MVHGKSLVRGIPCALVLAAVLAAPGPAAALKSEAVGAKFGAVSPDWGDAAVGFGVHWQFSQPPLPLLFPLELIYWSNSPVSDVNLNVNGQVTIWGRDRVAPYFGGGLGLHFYSFDTGADGLRSSDRETDFGLNILAGMRGPAWQQADWFVEGRFVATDNSQLMLLVGLNFQLASLGGGGQEEP